MYVALAASTPPKGDADSWKKKTTAILEAYKAGDTKALAKATNCGACHKEFRAK
jgi:cytochrome c551/c552